MIADTRKQVNLVKDTNLDYLVNIMDYMAPDREAWQKRINEVDPNRLGYQAKFGLVCY